MEESKEPNNCEESKSSSPGRDQQGAPLEQDEANEIENRLADGAPKVSIDYSSDSSESNEKCPICLLSFYDQEVGTPDMCSHAFCASCIEAWAKMVKTCPIDRKAFATINIYQNYEDRTFLRSVTVITGILNSFTNDLPLLLSVGTAPLQPPAPPPIALVDVDRPGDKCEICHRADREDVMLLCDECDCGYHIDCLVPALLEIPHGSWFCSNCPQEQESEVLTNKFNLARPEMAEEVENYVEPVRKKSRQVAQITRTKQSELIRKTIMAILSRTKPGGRERRRKKRGRRSRTEPRNAPPDFDPSLRLPIRSAQRCAGRSDQALQRSFFRERQPMLNLFGSAHQLETVYNNEEENDDLSSPFESVRGPPLYVSQPEGEVSSQVVCRQIVGYRNMQNILKIKNIIHAPRERPALRVTPTTAPANLLDSIMESQQIWHSRDGIKDVIVAKGGNISLKRRTIDTNINPSPTDGLDTAAGASSNSASAAAINRNHYQNNNATNQRVGGASQYQQQASSSRNYSNLTELTSASGLSDMKPGGQAALPAKKTIKDMFCDSDSEEEPPKPAKPPVRPPRRFSDTAPIPERKEPEAKPVLDCNFWNPSPPNVVEPDLESYTPEIRNFEETLEEEAAGPLISETIPPQVTAGIEILMANFKTNYPNEKPKKRRTRSKSKEPDKDRKKSLDRKKKANRRRSSSRSRSRSRRRASPRRRSRNTRSRSRSKNRSHKKKSRERSRRYSRSPVERKKQPKRRKSRSRTRSKSPIVNRSRSRSLNRNNKTSSRWKGAGKRKVRSRTKSRSRDRKVWSWRNRSPSPIRGGKTPPLPAAAKGSAKKQQAEIPPRVDAIVYTQDPVAIIDLTNGVKEIPSEKEVIVVSDSDHENETTLDAVAPAPAPLELPTVNDEAVTEPSTPPYVEPDVARTPSPVITARTSPQISCPTTLPAVAAPVAVVSPIAHTSQTIGQLPLPVEIQKLLQTFDTEKLLNNNLLSQINLVNPFGGTALLPFAPVASAISLVPELEATVVPKPPPIEPQPAAGYDSPYSPGSSDFNDLCTETSYNATTSEAGAPENMSALGFNTTDPKSDFDDLFGQSPNENSYDEMLERRLSLHKDDDAIFEEKKARIFSDPRDKDKYLVKLSLQKRASDEAKEQLKPFYSTKQITKQEYKDILRSAVPKICRSREVNPLKIQSLIAAYVKKMHHQRKKK